MHVIPNLEYVDPVFSIASVVTWNMSVLLSWQYSTTTVWLRDSVKEMLCCPLLCTACNDTADKHRSCTLQENTATQISIAARDNGLIVI